jgi:hypothetical protein
MVIFSSNTNFVSAAVECFGKGSLDHYFCIAETGEPNSQTFIIECVKENGEWSCNQLNKKAPPPGIDQVIEDTIQEVGPSNPNDSKDLGGMITDEGITKSPIQ